MTTFPHELANLLAARTINGVAEGVALALLAWVLLRLTGRANSATRFAVWFFTLVAVAVAPWLHGFGSGATTAGTASFAHPFIIPATWAKAFLAIWTAIAAIGLARVALGLWQVRKLRESSSTLDLAMLDSELQSAWQESQPSRNVELAVSSELRVPTAIGFLRPMVILPDWAMRELSSEELRSVLIHELAHLRRHDDWTNLAQKILRAIFFFHPAIWWVERQLSLEREMACDDAVLAHTGNPHSYAQCLVRMAEKSFLRRGFALAQAAVSRMQQTSQRVMQILDWKRTQATSVWRPAIGAVAVAAVVSAAGLSHSPELVAFEDAPPPVATATAPHVAMANLQQPRSVKALARPKSTAFTGSKRAQPQLAASATQARLTRPAAVHDALAAAAPPAVLVVFRTEQFGVPGVVHWMVYVWQVEVVDPSQFSTGPKVTAKSI